MIKKSKEWAYTKLGALKLHSLVLKGVLISFISRPLTFSGSKKHHLHLPPQVMLLSFFPI